MVAPTSPVRLLPSVSSPNPVPVSRPQVLQEFVSCRHGRRERLKTGMFGALEIEPPVQAMRQTEIPSAKPIHSRFVSAWCWEQIAPGARGKSDFVGPRRSRAGANEGEHRRKGCHILAARNHLVRLSLRFADKPTNRKNAKATWQQSLPHVLIICVHPFLALSASHTTWPLLDCASQFRRVII